MCREVRKSCECGKQNVQFHMRDNVMGEEVLSRLFCPDCSANVEFDDTTMINDNGWILEYDMDMAHFFAVSKLMVNPSHVGPEFIFDQGYATWQEMYPGEQRDILAEREEIMSLAKKEPKRYLEKISSWNIARINRLKDEGWRKAMYA